MADRRTIIRFLIGGAALGAAGLLAVLLFGWSGIYNVAASKEHWAITRWFLAFTMRNSVENRAAAVEAPPPLDDIDMIRLGAGHFHGGCAYCHGAPGIPISPISRGMLPSPPDLHSIADEWNTRQLFWIVQHGIKYTGMPAWPSQKRGDEVWAVVAFLEQLPRLDEQEYRELALGVLEPEPLSGQEVATEAEASAEAERACARCHGVGGSGPMSALVPVLHGQPMEYLLDSLEAYAAGLRESGIMQPIAADLSDDAMRDVASYYAGLPRPPSPSKDIDREAVARGRIIATEGIPAREIPPCLACHGSDAHAGFPRLAGQHARYLIGQLGLFKQGINNKTAKGAIMAPIAQRLSEQQIKDVSAYFASLPADGAGLP